MALNPQSLLAQLSPARGLDLSGLAPAPGESMARQQLALARQRFAFEKKQQEEQAELERMKLAGEQARREALAEKERVDREETAKAELLKQRQAGALKYAEAVNSGQPDQVEALRPYLESLGSGIDITRGAGMPSFRFHMDTEADRNKGWETATRPLDQGLYDAEPPPLAAAPTPGETGTLTDMQAMADDRLSRIGPAFRDIVQAHPEAYRGLATEAAVGVGSMNLPADKALTELRMQLGGPIELMKAQIQAGAQQDQFREKRDQLTVMDQSTLRKRGEDSAVGRAKEADVPGGVRAITTADEIMDLLEDGLPENDTMIAGALLSLQDVKGIPSDKDLAMAFGMDKASTITQILDYIGTKVKGGFQPEQREAIKSFVKRVTESQRQKVYDYLDSTGQIGDLDENERRGYVGGVERTVPGWLRDEYDEDRGKKKKGKGAEPSGQFDPGSVDFDTDLEALAAEHDLDPDKVRGLIGPESGGKANARNKDSGATGLIQFLPSVAKELGTSTEELAGMTPSEQLPFVMKYLSDWGINSKSSRDDYAMAVAAPGFIGKSPDTVVYPKSSDPKSAWAQNPAWRPADGGDITVGSIQAYYRGEKAKGAEAPKAELPMPTTDTEKRIRDMMLRQQGGR